MAKIRRFSLNYYTPAEILNLIQLRKIRKEAGHSCSSIARALGIHSSRYSAMEIGKCHFRLWHFRQICYVLNLDPLTIASLLNLTDIPKKDIKRFLKACSTVGITPAQALGDFLKAFCLEAANLREEQTQEGEKNETKSG